MKKYLFVVLTFIFVLSACSATKEIAHNLKTSPLSVDSNINGLKKITGMLNYSGSEPFPSPTIFISDTLSYKLIGDENFLNKEYSNLNGQQVTLYGNTILKGTLTYFEVHFYTLKEN